MLFNSFRRCGAICAATLMLTLSLTLLAPTASQAQPATGGTGPGGIGTTDGTSSLTLWLRGDTDVFQDAAGTTAATTTSDPVRLWRDQSGFGNDANQVSTGEPAFTSSSPSMNSRSAIAFTGSGGDHLNLPTPGPTGINIANSEYEMFISAQSASSSTQFLIAGGNEDYEMHLNGTAGSRFIPDGFAGGVGASDIGANGAFTDGSAHVFAARVVDTGSSTFTGTHRVDGTDSTDLVASGADSASTTALRLGQRNNTSLPLTGEIADVVIYNTSLNNVQRTLVDNHLASRYGTTLASGVDRYAGDTALNGDYDLGVFGIGSDSSGTVDNTGHDGFGIDASSSGTLDSGEFVLAGHKTATNGTTTTGFDAGTVLSGTRWTRDWFIDANGDDVELDLAFDFADAGLASPTGTEEFSLLLKLTELDDYSVLETGGLLQPNGTTVLFTDIATGSIDGGIVTLGVNVQGQAVPEPASIVLWSLLGLIGAAVSARRLRCRR